jgi:H+-transporting ATPase
MFSMAHGTTQVKVTDSKRESKPDPKDDFKSLPLAELENKLSSSPDGLSQAEADMRMDYPTFCPCWMPNALSLLHGSN